MKKYKVDIWSEETYKKVFEANSEEEAEEKVSYMGQNEMEEKAEDTWDVDGFPMLCTVEEIK